MASKVSISSRLIIRGFYTLLIFFAVGCSITKTVPEGRHLLMKVKFKEHGTAAETNKLPNYKEQVKYKPNRKILGVTRFHLRIYNLATHPTDSSKNHKRLRKYFREIGDAPVLFDSSLAETTNKNIQQHLFNSGYYHASVYYEVVYKGKKAKRVIYHVTPGQYYSAFTYEFECKDSVLSELIQKEWGKSHIKSRRRLEFDQITKERDRIFTLARNNGFYSFKRDYLDFVIDTFQNDHIAKIKLKVDLPPGQLTHTQFFLDTITVRITSPYHKPLPDVEILDNAFYYRNGYPISMKVIHSKQQLRTGYIFQQSEIDLSYRRLSELGVFAGVDVQLSVSKLDSSKLNVEVLLTPGFLQSYAIEPQIISSDLSNQIASTGNYRNYGLAGVLTYSHKNIFRGAERMDLSLTFRAESQFRSDLQQDRFFSNFQTGITSNIYIPSSRLWEKFAVKRKISTVRSVISLSYIYENNLDFNRNILPLSYSYQFVKDKSIWFFTPLEIFYSNSRIEPGFLDNISPQNLEFVKRLFANNLITSSGLRWNYTDFKGGNPKDYVMLRTNLLEVGGNIHRTGRRLMDSEQSSDTSYNFLGVTYFQFIKSEIDLRVSKYIDVNNTIAYRLNVGAGIPYGNDDILPFDKRFFIGGSNSLRGWRPRTLGPGSYSDTTTGTRIDRSGDMIIQGSVEYRFKFISPLELGVFLDAGNVWNIVPNAGTNPAELFTLRRFMGEMALNTGIGFRFDFDFFLFRLDWGIQLRDPEITANNGWVARDFLRSKGVQKYSVLNLGIGYPF